MNLERIVIFQQLNQRGSRTVLNIFVSFWNQKNYFTRLTQPNFVIKFQLFCSVWFLKLLPKMRNYFLRRFLNSVSYLEILLKFTPIW